MTKPLFELQHVQKSYSLGFKKARPVLKDVTFSIYPGEIVGLVGQSGCGKSTLGQILAGLLRHDAGQIFFRGQPVYFPLKGDLRREIQILFQHPETSFDPRMTLEKSLLEPFLYYRLPLDETGAAAIAFLLRADACASSAPAPSAFGRGTAAPAILRVLALKPSFLVLDEPTSMLDAISQAQILDILKGLNQQLGLSYLFITHDPDVATRFCSRIFQLEDGVCKALTI